MRKKPHNLKTVSSTDTAHCWTRCLVGERLRFLFVLANKLSMWLPKPKAMRAFDVNAPQATQLKAVIKHTINLPPLNSVPLCRAYPWEAPLAKRDKKLINFPQVKLYFWLCSFWRWACLSDLVNALWEFHPKETLKQHLGDPFLNYIRGKLWVKYLTGL